MENVENQRPYILEHFAKVLEASKNKEKEVKKDEKGKQSQRLN